MGARGENTVTIVNKAETHYGMTLPHSVRKIFLLVIKFTIVES